MEETVIKLASTLGGFAGLVCVALIIFLGKEVIALGKTLREELRVMAGSIDRITRMELMRLIASPHISTEVKNQLGEQLKEVEDAQRTGR